MHSRPKPGFPQQNGLFCPCGALPAVAGRCRTCYAAWARSRHRFGGNREAVLARDRGRCFVCGGRPERPHVHHRRRRCQDRRWLATLCPACHARVHRLRTVPAFAPPTLLELWVEQHPGAPIQLWLPLEVRADA